MRYLLLIQNFGRELWEGFSEEDRFELAARIPQVSGGGAVEVRPTLGG